MPEVPMNDLRRTYDAHSRALERTAIEVMRSGWWLNGPKYDGFCKAFAASLGVAQCVGVGNGTDALELAIRALMHADRRFTGRANGQTAMPGIEIVTVANAGGYASTACYLAGCVPVFADIDHGDQLLSIPAAIAALSEHTLAVVATHLYGGFVDVMALRCAMNAAGYGHVAILEDCAQAHGLTGERGVAGACGAMATFSFYPTKNLGALGDAGAIVTNNDNLASHVRRLHQYGWDKKYHVGDSHGRNSRMDELQAAMLIELLPYLDEDNARRVAILDDYQGALPSGVEIVRSDRATVAHLAVLKTDDRDRLRHHFASHGVATDIHYPVLDCDQKGWHGLPMRIGPAGLDVSRASVTKILTVPCFPTMTDEEVGAVCEALASYSA